MPWTLGIVPNEQNWKEIHTIRITRFCCHFARHSTAAGGRGSEAVAERETGELSEEGEGEGATKAVLGQQGYVRKRVAEIEKIEAKVAKNEGGKKLSTAQAVPIVDNGGGEEKNDIEAKAGIAATAPFEGDGKFVAGGYEEDEFDVDDDRSISPVAVYTTEEQRFEHGPEKSSEQPEFQKDEGKEAFRSLAATKPGGELVRKALEILLQAPPTQPLRPPSPLLLPENTLTAEGTGTGTDLRNVVIRNQHDKAKEEVNNPQLGSTYPGSGTYEERAIANLEQALRLQEQDGEGGAEVSSLHDPFSL